MDEIRAATGEEIDARSKDLMAEFFEHAAKVKAEFGEDRNVDAIFQGWAIQKIASLQLLTLELARVMRENDRNSGGL